MAALHIAKRVRKLSSVLFQRPSSPLAGRGLDTVGATCAWLGSRCYSSHRVIGSSQLSRSLCGFSSLNLASVEFERTAGAFDCTEGTKTEDGSVSDDGDFHVNLYGKSTNLRTETSYLGQLQESLLHMSTSLGLQRSLVSAVGVQQSGNGGVALLLDRRRGRSSNSTSTFSRRGMATLSDSMQAQIDVFNRGVDTDEAVTPPSSWYTSPEIHNLELEKVFERRWQAVGHVEQLQAPGDFFTGKVGRVRYVVCKDEEGTLRAFHNVCRHHAAAVATGSGCASSFVCPYHGWTYGLDGKLQKAARIGGIKNFKARDNGLLPLLCGTWGPFVLVSLPSKDPSKNTPEQELLGSVAKAYNVEKEWLGSVAKALTEARIDSSLRHVTRREYILNCNWKVFCDNYLDGGYHVQYAHQGLASALNLKSYSTTVFEKGSIQTCRAASRSTNGVTKKSGEVSSFAFVYPNFMINRYGPWMDTNLVLPITPSQCKVIFDYFLEPSCLHDEDFIKASLERSDVVQQEDIALCEAVQDGLQSPAYDVGRYAPGVEYAMHRFHILLHEDLSGDSEAFSGMDIEDIKKLVFTEPFL